MDIETFDLHGLILCVSEGVLSQLLYVHNVGIEFFHLHGQILCASAGFLSLLLCVHNGGLSLIHISEPTRP